MKCPKCGIDDDKVLDSRSAREGAAIRRRRECLKCSCRFTTYEEVVRDEVLVVKRDGSRQAFERAKVEMLPVLSRIRPTSGTMTMETAALKRPAAELNWAKRSRGSRRMAREALAVA